ncbi:TPA: phage tail protein [Escherichia coli]|nr:phage tail protein [Escherichia coli]
MPCRPETAIIQNLGLQETVNQASGALQKDQNGNDVPDKATFVKNIGACRAFSGYVSIGGDNGNWTTAQFIDWLESQGAFNHPYWMCKGSWSYASNKIITDTGCGNIQLAGAVIEVMGVKSAMTIRVTTPTTVTNGTAKAQFTYINHGNDYFPGWRRDWNRAGDTMTGELITTSQNALRMIAGNYGVILRQDGGSLYLLVTANGDQYGSWNSLRPFYFDLSTGTVTMGHGLKVNGQVAPTDYSNFDSRYALKTAAVTSIRLGTYTTQTMQKGVMFEKAGYVITGLGIVGEVDGDDPARLRPLQYCINGSWYTAATT